MRLDKLLAHSGYGTRKDVKRLITSGVVTVNDETCKKIGKNVDLKHDQVAVMNQTVAYQKYYYFLMNKPAGVISATEDSLHQTVIDILEPEFAKPDLFPVGRLDIDTTGLLLLTNNGQLAHQLLSPRKEVSKVYWAVIDGLVTEEDRRHFASGLDLGDFTSQPAQLKILAVDTTKQQSTIEVEIHEGKFHQVKRMFQAVGHEVKQLKRIAMGPIQLDDALAEGEVRELNAAEIEALKPYGLIEE